MTKKLDTGSRKWVDPDDAPELTEEFFLRGEIRDGDKIIRRGRPPIKNTKKQITLRLDADIIESFKSEGTGWQTRMNDALRHAIDHR